MGRKKKETEEVESKLVRLQVRIEPAFRLVIEDDDTGKKWSGHTWYGDTGMDVLRKMRNSLKMDLYKHDDLRVRSSTPALVAATGWKEPIIDSD